MHNALPFVQLLVFRRLLGLMLRLMLSLHLLLLLRFLLLALGRETGGHVISSITARGSSFLSTTAKDSSLHRLRRRAVCSYSACFCSRLLPLFGVAAAPAAATGCSWPILRHFKPPFYTNIPIE